MPSTTKTTADRLHTFKVGDEVMVTWHHVGTRLEASAISPVTAHLGGQVEDTADISALLD